MHEPIADAVEAGWQPLPARARGLFMLALVPVTTVLPGVAGFVLATVADGPALPVALAAAVAGAAFGSWLALRQHAHSYWCHDREGLAIRRGRWWQRETRVPASRVQHLDLKRGPVQRRCRLATLVVHTAGTQNSAVSVHHLDEADAEQLREALSAQIDHEDD